MEELGRCALGDEGQRDPSDDQRAVDQAPLASCSPPAPGFACGEGACDEAHGNETEPWCVQDLGQHERHRGREESDARRGQEAGVVIETSSASPRAAVSTGW